MVKVKDNALIFGKNFQIDFQRTLRIPDDDKVYPLPPGLGAFPIRRVADYRDRVPPDWSEHDGLFIPMYQREAMWINFSLSQPIRSWPERRTPHAVKVGVGKVNAVSGSPWCQDLRPEEQDYMVCPPQPWLDGVNTGAGQIRQFVAMPLGTWYTVEAQVTGDERAGGIQIAVYRPKGGKPAVWPPPGMNDLERAKGVQGFIPYGLASGAMGLAAGGTMKQKIYPDPFGIDTWDQENRRCVYLYIVNSAAYHEITGQEPPPTPVTAQVYAQYDLPWFDLYDEEMRDIPAPGILKQIKSVREMDHETGVAPQEDDASTDISEDKIKKIGPRDRAQKS